MSEKGQRPSWRLAAEQGELGLILTPPSLLALGPSGEELRQHFLPFCPQSGIPLIWRHKTQQLMAFGALAMSCLSGCRFYVLVQDKDVGELSLPCS